MNELIRNATIDDFKRGYVWNSKDGEFICLVCGENIGENIKAHILEHGNEIERLLLLDKKYTGLTEIQKEFLAMVSNKYNDKEIASKLGYTESTIRNMRFALRERARQARAFLAVMELAEEKVPVVKPLKIRTFPAKEEKRKALLPRFANLFEPNKEYKELEVKEIIKTVYEDDAIIRRYLVDYGYLNRNSDGSKYYRDCEENRMDNEGKRQLINEYKQQEIEMGIIQIYNKETGYSYVDISENLYKPFETIKFQLNMGKFKLKYKKLQEDWNNYGEGGFTFEVVEKLKPNEVATDKEKIDDLKELLNIWIDSQGEGLKLYNK